MAARFILLVMVSAKGWACVCSGNYPSVKLAWKEASAVFLGTVEIVDPDGTPRDVRFREQFVSIRVDEAFKGVSRGQTVELHQGGGDCSAKFTAGRRAVFYLQKEMRGRWRLRPCTRSIGSVESGGRRFAVLKRSTEISYRYETIR